MRARILPSFRRRAVGRTPPCRLGLQRALHGLLPLFVTGNVTCEKIELYVQSRVALLGSGWDLLLANRYEMLQETPNVSS